MRSFNKIGLDENIRMLPAVNQIAKRERGGPLKVSLAPGGMWRRRDASSQGTDGPPMNTTLKSSPGCEKHVSLFELMRLSV